MWAVLRMREATPLFRIFGSTLASFAGMMLSFDAIGFGRHGVSHRARTSSDNDVQGTSALGPGRVETFFVPQKLHATGRDGPRRDRLSLFLLYRIWSQSERNLEPC